MQQIKFSFISAADKDTESAKMNVNVGKFQDAPRLQRHLLEANFNFPICTFRAAIKQRTTGSCYLEELYS